MSLCLSNPLTTQVRERQNFSNSLREWPRVVRALWLEQRRRRVLRQLLERDSKILDDIGLQAFEIDWALRLPLTQNAIACLHERAAQRRRSEFSMRQRRRPVTGLQQW